MRIRFHRIRFPWIRFHWLIVTFALLVASGYIGCRTAPVTGRRQLLVVPESSEISMGVTAFRDTLASEKLSDHTQLHQMVQRVGQRIASVADRPDYDWEFQLIDSPEMNAFCLPGGKVAIYEGILPICENEAGLAVVMAHEIAHALARHGGERMSQQYVVAGVGKAIEWVSSDREALTRERISQAYGLASKYGVILPYSRKHESEADHVGMILMARAGYDPREAPRFWQRFGRASAASEKPIEFLSTHPSDERRAANLMSLLDEGMEVYAQATTKYQLGEPIPLKVAQ